MKEKTFEEQAIDITNAMREFEKKFDVELEKADAVNTMQEARGFMEAVLKSIYYMSDDDDEGDTLHEHHAMEGRKELFV